MPISESQKNIFANYILNDIHEYVEGMCSGSSEERRFFSDSVKPSNELFIGCLFPRDQSIVSSIENSLSDFDETTAEESDDEFVGSASVPTMRKPYSLSVSFLTRPIGNISIIPTFSVYYRVIPTYQEYLIAVQKEHSGADSDFDPEVYINTSPPSITIEHPIVWERVDVILPELIFSLDRNESQGFNRTNFPHPIRPIWIETQSLMTFETLQGGEEAVTEFWSSGGLSSATEWEGIINLIDNGVMPGQPPEFHMFTISLVNTSIEPEYEFQLLSEPVLFNCNLEIFIGEIDLYEFPHQWKYQLPYSGSVTNGGPPTPFNVEYPILVWGNGCFPDYDESSQRIITQVTIKTKMKRISPLDTRNYSMPDDLKFANLFEDPITLLMRIYNELETYTTYYEGERDSNQKARDDFAQFEYLLERFNEGIVQINHDLVKKQSFQFMNETYMNAYGNSEGWRLFQLVFIVGNVPDITSTSHGEELDNPSVELLFVATGGGKTEAYVGLTIYLLFYQRLIGVQFGIATWVKFPLRLLAIDQFDRLLQIVIWAERIRMLNEDEDNITLGGAPFSLGFFVGSTEDFPGSVAEWVYSKMHNDIGNDAWQQQDFSVNEGHNENNGALLKKCPICESGGDYKWTYRPSQHRVIHWCEECGTEFYIYITDEEVYRFIPSVIVSTVDKIAVGAWRPSMSNLLGGQVFHCPNHGYSTRPNQCSIMENRCGNSFSQLFTTSRRYDDGRPFSANGPFFRFSCSGDSLEEINTTTHSPVLMVQDELHLLSENLGTTDSYFETLVDYIIMNNSGRLPKHIAMSATLAGARNQIGHLYLRHANLWPGDAPSNGPLTIPNYDAFYEHTDELHRLYIGIFPHGKSPDFSTYRVLQYSWCRIQNYLNDIGLVRQILRLNQNNISNSELIAFIHDYYKKSFVYQGRKIGTHNFANALDRIVNPDIQRKHNSYDIIRGDSVTGDNSLGEIRDFREQMQIGGDLDVLVSTSLISHGVDISNVNLMFFQGIPDKTSEFIQASSRVGRKYPGIIFISFYPSRSRDIELSSSFKMYIDTIRYWVEDVTISRWCKQALKEIFTTAFCFTLTSHGQEILGTHNQINRHWPYTIHCLGATQPRRPGYLAWRLWQQDFDERIKNVLKTGLGLTGFFQGIAPSDLLPISHSRQELEEMFEELFTEFVTTIQNIASSENIPQSRSNRQLALFCKNDLGSPIRDNSFNPNYIARWYQCMTGLRGIQAPVEIKPYRGTLLYLGG